MSERVTVLVVDDHDLLREGVAGALSHYEDLEVVGQASNASKAVTMACELEPDVVVMDLVMPGESGISAMRKITKHKPEIRFLALTSFTDGSLVREALEAGATSFLFKNVEMDLFANAVRSTAAGQSILAPGVTAHLVAKPSSVWDLTDREREVSDYIAAGLSNADIARELFVSVYTVKNHVRSILMKLGVESRTEAASMILNHRYASQGDSSPHTPGLAVSPPTQT